VWIPPAFAHGFLVLSDEAEVLYKMTTPWEPQNDRTLIWNDPDVNVRWPIFGAPILSEKDLAGKPWGQTEFFM
jgi:dTDP-4-dehydrorhamnose 3,5-epimerase